MIGGDQTTVSSWSITDSMDYINIRASFLEEQHGHERALDFLDLEIRNGNVNITLEGGQRLLKRWWFLKNPPANFNRLFFDIDVPDENDAEQHNPMVHFAPEPVPDKDVKEAVISLAFDARRLGSSSDGQMLRASRCETKNCRYTGQPLLTCGKCQLVMVSCNLRSDSV